MAGERTRSLSRKIELLQIIPVSKRTLDNWIKRRVGTFEFAEHALETR